MPFSIEARYLEEPVVRHGFFDTHEDAKVSMLGREKRPVAAAVYAGPTTSGGQLVAVYDAENGWVDTDRVSEPQWWNRVSREVQEWVLNNPTPPLDPGVASAIRDASGPLANIPGDGSEPTGHLLQLQDEQWVRYQRVLRVLGN